jgi:protein subunit release factor A
MTILYSSPPGSDKYRNIFLEIHALAGDDANGWMRDLMEMYIRYAENVRPQ